MSEKDLMFIHDELGHHIPCNDVPAWGAFMKNGRMIKRTTAHIDPDILVSTAFLGVDHSYGDEPEPILWETMVFINGEPLDRFSARYCSFELALAGHNEALKRVKEDLSNIQRDFKAQP